ncbi:MAG: response regulator [Candidatus Moraniibacteriota bacterium]
MPKILLIEDEEIFVDMFSESLRKAGFEVLSAKNGAWGIKEALSGEFDLFIIDMMMPAMSGDEVVVKLKEDEKTKDTPVIIISASVDIETQKKVEKMGVESFFVKTQITPTDLSKRVAELLSVKMQLDRFDDLTKK